MNAAFLLAAALCLDGAVGEPRRLWAHVPHPAVLMGRLVGWLDLGLNAGPHLRLKGIISVAILVIVAGGIASVLQQLGGLITLICAAILLAQKSLVDHVAAVAHGLRQSDQAGRDAVAMIVSRDVRGSNPSAVARSAIESLSENFSDGIIAPAFWFLIGGLPGIAIYKIVNTADSMIGYLTPRHAEFGWAAARLDDVLNWIPARLTAVLITTVAGASRHRARIQSDAALHKSPNAGWPEAAMAYALNIALAGPRSYHGALRAFAWVNTDGQHDLTPPHIDAAIAMVWKAWAAAVAVIFCVGVAIWAF